MGTENLQKEALPTNERLKSFEQDPTDNGLTELYYQYGRYLLIASSRPGGLPANLQGIWNRHVQPPWGSNYTTNINTEMNYLAGGNNQSSGMLPAIVRFHRPPGCQWRTNGQS
ncbi:hypothetical protein NXW75_12680 [Bacteroides xylanisolvens]|nr:hypothetical protein [Bacteroides xylanisolvens]